MNDATVLYYSANTENQIFEARIREKLLANIGGLPLVSVTQKPLPGFGKNICVGEHLNCYANEFRQIQIGLKEVTTPYVLVAEADCLYPPEYFQFIPSEKGRAYRYDNVWIQYCLDLDKKAKFYFKKYSDCAQAIDKNLWLEKIAEGLKGMAEWCVTEERLLNIFQIPRDGNYTWSSENPVVTFKTGKGVGRYTQILKNPPKGSLPYWGSAQSLREELFN